MAGSRDICLYLREPHVLVSRRQDELFIDPSHTYRLDLPAESWDVGPPAGITIRTLSDTEDAEAVNRIYATNGMVTAPVDVLVENAATPEFVHLVAEQDATGVVVGTITGVDHVEVFDDPESGSQPLVPHRGPERRAARRRPGAAAGARRPARRARPRATSTSRCSPTTRARSGSTSGSGSGACRSSASSARTRSTRTSSSPASPTATTT